MPESKKEILKNVPLFSGLSDDLLEHLAKKVETRALPDGSFLFYENDPGDVFFIIASGEVEVFKGEADSPNKQTLSLLQAGEYLGEMALLENKPRTANAQAITDCELLCLARQDFNDLLEQHPQMMRSITAVISARLRNMTDANAARRSSKLTAASKTRIFISYSRRNKNFAEMLNQSLTAAGIKTWVDWEDIPPSADWQKEIERGIRESDAFVFIISPDSIHSKICRSELEMALESNKRLIPVLHQELIGNPTLPKALSSANWIFMRSEEEMKANLESMLQAVNTDLDWLRMHTRLLARAIEWKESQKNTHLLLRGPDLEKAQAWLAKSSAAIDPKPLPLHGEYIQASREDARKRARLTQALGIVVLFAMLIATVVSIIGLQNATRARDDAKNAQATAVSNANFAATAQAAAMQSAANAAAAQAHAEASLAKSEQLRLALEANEILEEPLGNVETAALISLRALRNGYIPQADVVLGKASQRLYTIFALRGHQNNITSVDVSPDAKYLLTGSADNTARIWDAQTGKEVLVLRGHTDRVNSAAFSPDGKTALTASDDRTARLWDLQTGAELIQFSGHSEKVNSAQFSPNGKYVITASADTSIRLWETATGNQLAILNGHKGEVNCAIFSPDGAYILSGSDDRTVKMWNVNTLTQTREFPKHTREALAVLFSPDMKYIFTASDTEIRMFSMYTGLEAGKFTGHMDRVRAIDITKDGKFLLSGSSDYTARLWDVSTKQTLRLFSGHTGAILGAAFVGNHKQILTGSADHTARVWDTVNTQGALVFSGKSPLQAAALSNDKKYLAAGGNNNNVQLWNIQTQQPGVEIKGHINWISSIVFSPDNQFVLTASWDETARIWDASSGKQIIQFLGHEGAVSSAAFSPDGSHVLTGGEDKTARLWNVQTGKQIRIFTGHTDEVNTVAFSPDGEFILTSSDDHTARLWQTSNGFLVREFRGHADEVKAAVFSPDGKLILTASDDKTARLWNAATGAELLEFIGHGNQIKSAAFSPDGKYILTGSDDTTARLWEVVSGKEIRVFSAHTASIRSVAFSTDGKWVVTASFDSTAQIWDTFYADTIARTCSRIFRDLTEEERREYVIADALPSCSFIISP